MILMINLYHVEVRAAVVMIYVTCISWSQDHWSEYYFSIRVCGGQVEKDGKEESILRVLIVFNIFSWLF